MSGEVIRLPQAFLDKMERLLGEEYGAFLDSYDDERAQGLRFNPLKGDTDVMAAEYGGRFGLAPVPWCQGGYYYRPETRPGRDPLHAAGAYYIQEPSAMAVAELLDAQPGDAVLDLCAAPGGKTTHVAGSLGGRGLLVSNEIHPARAKILSQNVERWGAANAVVTNADAQTLRAHFGEFFDKIVVDAPCSGEGMFRKDEQARAEWSEENVALCAARQQEILEQAAAMLKPGGRLVYSTCTFSPEEDEDGIACFLERHPEFAVVRRETPLPGLSAGRPEWCSRPCPQTADTWRIFPHRSRGEGHYLALLEKSGKGKNMAPEAGNAGRGADSGETKRRREKPGKSPFWNDRAGKALVRDFFDETLAKLPEWWDEGRLILFGEQLYQAPAGMERFDGLRILRPGLHLGTLKKNRFEPSHALALALRREQARRSVNFTSGSAEIAAYLAGEALSLPPAAESAAGKGWALICVDGYPLGWVKAAGGVLKNHYPKGLRVMPDKAGQTSAPEEDGL